MVPNLHLPRLPEPSKLLKRKRVPYNLIQSNDPKPYRVRAYGVPPTIPPKAATWITWPRFGRSKCRTHDYWRDKTSVSAHNLISKRPTQPENFGGVPLFQAQSYYGILTPSVHGVSNFIRWRPTVPTVLTALLVAMWQTTWTKLRTSCAMCKFSSVCRSFSVFRDLMQQDQTNKRRSLKPNIAPNARQAPGLTDPPELTDPQTKVHDYMYK